MLMWNLSKPCHSNILKSLVSVEIMCLTGRISQQSFWMSKVLKGILNFQAWYFWISSWPQMWRYCRSPNSAATTHKILPSAGCVFCVLISGLSDFCYPLLRYEKRGLYGKYKMHMSMPVHKKSFTDTRTQCWHFKTAVAICGIFRGSVWT